MSAPTLPLTVLTPGRRAFDLAEIWRYRDLLYFLTRREITIRYKQSVLGIAWAVLQPVLTMAVFTVFLGRLAKMPSDGVPYPVFAYLGLLPWTYFSGAVTRAGGSLTGNSSLLSKVYVPRLLIPLSAVLSALVDFFVAWIVLVGLMFWYGLPPALSTVLLLPLIAATALFAQGIGMGLAALNVKYRDIQHATPFLMQLWMFATPVVYPASLVPEEYRLLFAANPMTGLIETFRAATLGRAVDWGQLGISLAVAAVLAALGFWRFRRMERVFADVV